MIVLRKSHPDSGTVFVGLPLPAEAKAKLKPFTRDLEYPLHITLLYLNDLGGRKDNREDVLEMVRDAISHNPPVRCKLTGVGRVGPDGKTVAGLVTVENGAWLHGSIVVMLTSRFDNEHIKRDFDFLPHVSLQENVPIEEALPDVPRVSWVCDRAVVEFSNGERHTIKFEGSPRKGLPNVRLAKSFANPFPGRTGTGKLSRAELERAIRLAITQEQEAIATYKAQAEECADAAVSKQLLSIAAEEEVHLGELQALLERIAPESAERAAEGRGEVKLSKSMVALIKSQLSLFGTQEKTVPVKAHTVHTKSGKVVHVAAGQAKRHVKPAEPKAEKKPKGSGLKSYGEMVAENMKQMGSSLSEWTALPIQSMKADVDGAGNDVSMPVYDTPKGFSPAPTLYKGSEGNACCELCGHPIKIGYTIQNEERKWLLNVGSECVTHFQEKSGQVMAKEATAKEKRETIETAINIQHELARKFAGDGPTSDIAKKFPQVAAIRAQLKELTGDIAVNMRDGKLRPDWFTDRQVSIYLKKHGDDLIQAVERAQAHLDNADNLIAQQSSEAQAKRQEEDAAKERLAAEKKRLNIEVGTLTTALVGKYQWPDGGTGDVMDASGKFAGAIVTRGGRVSYKPLSDPADLMPRYSENMDDAKRGIVQLSNPEILARIRRLDDLYRNGIYALSKSLVLRKSRTVAAHQLHTKSGKVVLVAAHTDKRPAAKPKAPAIPAKSAKPAASGEDTIRTLTLGEIRPDPEQHRKVFEPKKLQELADSIKETGQKTPIVVRPISDGGKVKYQIIAGERRYRACKQAGIKSIKAVIREHATDESILTEQVIENVNREQVTPMEEANAYRQLCDLYVRKAKKRKDWSGKDFKDPAVMAKVEDEAKKWVAKQTGKAQHHVTYYVKLTELAPEVQELVSKGALTPRHGNVLTRITDNVDDPKEKRERLLHQVRMARHAVAQGTKSEDLQRQVTEYVRAHEQQSMFDDEDLGGAEKLQRRAEEKAKVNSLVDALGKVIQASFSDKDAAFKPEFLTAGDLEVNMQKLSGAMKTLDEIHGIMERALAGHQAKEAVKRRVMAKPAATAEPVHSAADGIPQGQQGPSLFGKSMMLVLRKEGAYIHA